MGQARKLYIILLGGLMAVTGGCAAAPFCGQDITPPPMATAALAPPPAPARAVTPVLPAAPNSQPEDRPLPINLPAALQLAHASAVDIAAAAERIRVAAAVLEQAQVLWLPSVT